MLVGLSFGTSSAAVVDVLDTMVRGQLRKRPSAAFDSVVVHVDVDGEEETDDEGDSSMPQKKALLSRYAQRYPHFRFLRVPLAAALELNTIDWAALPIAQDPSVKRQQQPAGERLRDFLARLPSTTSRADVLRLLVRHVLLSVALREDCRAMVLGCSTTALAELTLGETAKGRGFSLPGMVGDGPLVVRRFGGGVGGGSPPTHAGEGEGRADGSALRGEEIAARLSVYYPNRELFRTELVQYAALVEPPLTDLVFDSAATGGNGPAAVVSHRDISIDEVMVRYFADVEKNYPSIVANVVRTAAKLDVPSDQGEGECCGLCGMGLDELGDERWKGEMGDDSGGEDGRLCYGCSRAMRG